MLINNPDFFFFFHRKSEMALTRDAGLSWRPTCSSTRSDQLTDTCWVSSCWKGAQSGVRSLMDRLPFPWCLRDPDSKPTGLQQGIVRLRRAGWKSCSQPATVTSPCWWETWRGSMKVCYVLWGVLFYISIAIVFYWLFSCYKSVPLLLFLLCLFNFFF